MIPQLERIKKNKSESFIVDQYSAPYFERSWHFHAECELLLVTKGYGNRIIGDNRKKFKEGDLVLVGANIPHAWFSDPSFFEPESTQCCESLYVQFDRAMFGTRFASLPEMQPIQSLLDEAKYGLTLTEDNPEIIRRLLKLPDCSKLDRILEFIKILELFKNAKYERLISQDYLSNSFITKSERVKKVHEYVINNYMYDVDLTTVAEMLEMNTSAFCRFFKNKTKKTFSEYVKEVRIDCAQQLLINTDLASYQVGLECGFSSIAYFNQSFKSISGISPLKYRTKYKVI